MEPVNETDLTCCSSRRIVSAGCPILLEHIGDVPSFEGDYNTNKLLIKDM